MNLCAASLCWRRQSAKRLRFEKVAHFVRSETHQLRSLSARPGALKDQRLVLLHSQVILDGEHAWRAVCSDTHNVPVALIIDDSFECHMLALHDDVNRRDRTVSRFAGSGRCGIRFIQGGNCGLAYCVETSHTVSEAHAPPDKNQVVPPSVAWISTENRRGTQVKRNRPIEKQSEEAIQTAASSVGIYAANWKTELMRPSR